MKGTFLETTTQKVFHVSSTGNDGSIQTTLGLVRYLGQWLLLVWISSVLPVRDGVWTWWGHENGDLGGRAFGLPWHFLIQKSCYTSASCGGVPCD